MYISVKTFKISHFKQVTQYSYKNANSGQMLTQRLRSWASIKPTLDQCLVFAGRAPMGGCNVHVQTMRMTRQLVRAMICVIINIELNQVNLIYNNLEGVKRYDHTQPTRYVEPILVQCWPAVYDVGPTLNQYWFNVSCLLISLTLLPCECLLPCGHLTIIT